MMSRSASSFGIVAAIALVVVFWGTAAPPSQAQSAEVEWAEALVERFQFFDLAEVVYADLAARGDALSKASAARGRARLARREAARTVGEKRFAKNQSAFGYCDEAAKLYPEGTPAAESFVFEWSLMGQEIASETAAWIAEGRAGDAEASQKLVDATSERLERIVLALGKIYEKHRAIDDSARPEWLMARRAELSQAIAKQRIGQLIGSIDGARGSKAWYAAMDAARRKLEEFVLDNEDRMVGLVGYLWLAKTLGEYVGAPKSNVGVEQVEATYRTISDRLLGPAAGSTDDLDDEAVSLLEQSKWWLFEFLNQRGMTAKAITEGDAFRAQWTKLGREFSVFGRLAMVEYARALASEGRYAESLKFVLEVTAGRNDAARTEADALISMLTRILPDAVALGADALFAGAEGALAASGRDEAKIWDAIDLFTRALAALPRENRSPAERLIGAKAALKLGQAYYRQGRRREAAIAFEIGYKDAWNAEFADEPRLVGDLADLWRTVLREALRGEPSNPTAKAQLDEGERWILSHPARSSAVGSSIEIEFEKAQQEFAAGNYAEARRRFAEIAQKDGEHRIRAKIRLATCDLRLMRAKADATSAEWKDLAARFEEIRGSIDAAPAADADAATARRRASAETDYSAAEAYWRAAEASADANEKTELRKKVVAVTDGLADRFVVRELIPFAGNYRFQALLALGDNDGAEATYRAMVAAAPDHELTADTALRMTKIMKAKIDAMPTKTPEDRAARRAADAQVADLYRKWILTRRSKKLSDWSAVAGLYFDLEKWDDVHEILQAAEDATRGQTSDKKTTANVERRFARASLELAKVAFLAGQTAIAGDRFKAADERYQRILSDAESPLRGYVSVTEEAAENCGGSIVAGKDGAFVFVPGMGQFQKAQELWSNAQKRLQATSATDSADAQNLAERIERARFHVFLMELKKIEADPGKAGMDGLKRELSALSAKTGGQPGGAVWGKKFAWLLQRVGL